MRVVVDRARCEANALCMAAAPEVFAVDDDDVLHVLEDSPPEEMRSRVEEAVRVCPRAALSLID
jgi:ferredoxin